MKTLALSFFAVSLAIAAVGCSSSSEDDDQDTASSALSSCRDLSSTYRVSGTCWINHGEAADGTPVKLTQAPGCTTITLEAKVKMPPPQPPSPPGPHSPYDHCALACFDLGSHDGYGYLPPGCKCGQPPPPAPPPVYAVQSQTLARSSVQDWSAMRIDIGSCTLIRTGSLPTPAPTVTPPPAGAPTAHLARGSFLMTPTLGYDEFLAPGTVVGLAPRPSNVTNQNGYTWVTYNTKTGFVASRDLTN
jgi:hypothetical protein